MVLATSTVAALALVELGLVVAGLALLARLAGRLGISAVPLYLVAGLVFGDGGVAEISLSQDFVMLAAEIGVLLLLLTLGLEYSSGELRAGLRSGIGVGALNAVLNALPGFAVGLLLGWSVTAAVLLGGVTWVSSSGVVAKVLGDLGRLRDREAPAVMNVLVIEDLAMAAYLPIVAAMVADQTASRTVMAVVLAIGAVAIGLWFTVRFGPSLSRSLAGADNETFLLSILGLMLVVGGLAQQLQISSAVGAFLVGLALSGPAKERASRILSPLRDLFAAVFFVSFSFQIAPADLPPVLGPAVVLAALAAAGKTATGWVAARRHEASTAGRLRAGTLLIPRGEFSIVIAALGAPLPEGARLGAMAAACVLLTCIGGPLAAKQADRLAGIRLGVPIGLRPGRGRPTVVPSSGREGTGTTDPPSPTPASRPVV